MNAIERALADRALEESATVLEAYEELDPAHKTIDSDVNAAQLAVSRAILAKLLEEPAHVGPAYPQRVDVSPGLLRAIGAIGGREYRGMRGEHPFEPGSDAT